MNKSDGGVNLSIRHQPDSGDSVGGGGSRAAQSSPGWSAAHRGSPPSAR